MKQTILLGVAIFFSSVIYTQAQDASYNNSLLWRISSPEMKKPAYLFGTIHMICKEDYVWSKKMQKCLDSCDEVCFEMDMDDPSLMIEIAKGLADENGKDLKSYFSEEQYRAIDAFMTDSLKTDISLFQTMKPAALQSLFAAIITGCETPSSYEMNIMEDAKKKNKNISGLESAKEQLALLDSIPTDSIIIDLIAIIHNYSKEKSEYKQMVMAYKNQDLATLFNLIQQSKDLGDNIGIFLDERNEKWISRMVERMDSSSVFFAVGAGHLWGNSGLINLLRQSGYTVTPMK